MATAASNPADGAAKLATVFKPLLDEQGKSVREYIVANTQEVLLAIERLTAKVDTLEKVVGEKKKQVRAEKKEPAAGAPAEAAVEAPATAQKNFTNNKLVHFRNKFKEDQTFRDKYATAEIRELMDKDESIQKKADAAQKLTLMGTFCWNHIKANKKEAFDMFEKEFNEAKKASEEANKAQQQTVEAHTPPAAAAPADAAKP